jgi:Fe-S-cluster containining protein
MILASPSRAPAEPRLMCQAPKPKGGCLEMFKRGFAKPGIPSFDKPAGERCPHQRHSKGCVVYARRPLACQVWNCRWLGGADTADQSRLDRAHYFIDIMPDYITFVEGDKRANVEAVQV